MQPLKFRVQGDAKQAISRNSHCMFYSFERFSLLKYDALFFPVSKDPESAIICVRPHFCVFLLLPGLISAGI